jgi:hypothetical protein
VTADKEVKGPASDCTVTRLRREEIPELIQVKARVYGIEAREVPEYYLWKFFDNPHRDGEVPFWVLREGPRMIGGIGAMPVRMRVLDREVRGEFACDMFIERGRQRSGLGTVLMDAYIGDSPWPLMVNTSASLHRFLAKRGFVDLSPGFRFRAKPLRPGAILQERWGGWRGRVARLADPALRMLLAVRTSVHSRGREAGVVVEEKASFAPWSEVVREAAERDRGILVVRDPAYLRWKYQAHPIRSYRILCASRSGRPVAFATFRLRKPSESSGPLCLIQELFAPRAESGARLALLDHIVRSAREAGAPAVKVLATDPAVQRDLRAAGFLTLKDSPGFLCPRQPGLDGSEIFKLESWVLTGGDCDLDYGD